MYTFINLYKGVITDNKTGQKTPYRQVVVLDKDGRGSNLKVHRDFDETCLAELKMGQKIDVVFIPGFQNIAQVIDVKKAQ
jgi:hypothetical protein